MKSLSLDSDSLKERECDQNTEKQIIDDIFNRPFEAQDDMTDIQEEDEIDLMNENTPWINNDHSSEDELTTPQNHKYVKQNPHFNVKKNHNRKKSYAQDDINNNKNPISSKKLFQKRKSDSFFLNNHGALIPRIYGRQYQPKKTRQYKRNDVKIKTKS